jgi:Glyoxalase-like domain
MIEIDHICLGVQNVYEGAQRLRDQTGLGNYEGGWFPTMGLANRIVPLGDDTYIEVEGVVDAFELQRENPTTCWFRDATSAGDVFIGWCARVSSVKELEELAKRLNTEVIQTQIRRRPDGSHPVSRLAPATFACWKQGLPNFFCIDDLSKHPSRQPITTPGIMSIGIKWLELGGSEEEMSDWLGVRASSLSLRFNGKSAGLHSMAVQTQAGEKLIRLPAVTDVM